VQWSCECTWRLLSARCLLEMEATECRRRQFGMPPARSQRRPLFSEPLFTWRHGNRTADGGGAASRGFQRHDWQAVIALQLVF